MSVTSEALVTCVSNFPGVEVWESSLQPIDRKSSNLATSPLSHICSTDMYWLTWNHKSAKELVNFFTISQLSTCTRVWHHEQGPGLPRHVEFHVVPRNLQFATEFTACRRNTWKRSF